MERTGFEKESYGSYLKNIGIDCSKVWLVALVTVCSVILFEIGKILHEFLRISLCGGIICLVGKVDDNMIRGEFSDSTHRDGSVCNSKNECCNVVRLCRFDL